MPVFYYQALTELGTIVAGETVALDSTEVARALDQKGLLPRRIWRKREWLQGWRRRISPELLLPLIQELTALLRAGLTIPDALKVIADQPHPGQAEKIVLRVLEQVRHGTAFSEACAAHPELFDEILIAALKTGEQTGDTIGALSRYQVVLRQRLEFHKKITQALIYPGFLLGALAIILAILFTFVLPRFVSMYSDFGAELPWPTRVLISVVNYLPVYMAATLSIVAVVFLCLQRMKRTALGKIRLDRMLLAVPMWGTLRAQYGMSQLARTLEALLASGMPLISALRICRSATVSPSIGASLQGVIEQVLSGGSLTNALREAQVFPAAALKMIDVGERTGELPRMFGDMASYFEERLAATLTRVTTLMEPMLMFVIGGILGAVIISLYLPIFYVVDVIK